MSDNELPTVVSEGMFNIFDVDVKCYVLSNGKRIIDEISMARLLEAMSNSDTKINQDELERFAKWSKGLL